MIDNAPSHRDAESVINGEEGVKLLRLPPYSPMLNPIENVWSFFKSDIKHRMTDAFISMMDDNCARQKGMSLTAYRMSMMESMCDDAMSLISSNVCQRACSHQSVALARAMKKENMEVGR